MVDVLRASMQYAINTLQRPLSYCEHELGLKVSVVHAYAWRELGSSSILLLLAANSTAEHRVCPTTHLTLL